MLRWYLPLSLFKLGSGFICQSGRYSSLNPSGYHNLGTKVAFCAMSGRGAYYKNKYGNRSGRGGGRSNDSGRGRGRSGGSGSGGPFPKRGRFEGVSQLTVGGSFVDLARLLESIDGRNYPTYHDLEREWHHDEKANNKFSLRIGRAQSDPFAPPTWCQIRIPATEFVDNWPETLRDNPVARVAASDFLLRHLYRTCQSLGADKTVRTGGGSGWSGPKGGDLQILAPTQHVLEQSAVQIAKADNGTNQTDVVLQMTVNLPARGRTILGYAAKEIFCNILPQLVAALLALPTKPLWDHVHLIEDQVWLQNQLAAWGLVAFIPNGSILPRRSGVDDRPLLDAVPFSSPPNLECSFDLPNTNNTIIGMGIPEGVTLICGGGFHGKSTLLQALQWGIYPKIQGDGREFCVVRPLATSIRAEDGRSVQSVNIADFLRDLPGKAKDTTCFSTENASGSTSQASSIVEVRRTVAMVAETTSYWAVVLSMETEKSLRNDSMERLTAKIKSLDNGLYNGDRPRHNIRIARRETISFSCSCMSEYL